MNIPVTFSGVLLLLLGGCRMQAAPDREALIDGMQASTSVEAYALDDAWIVQRDLGKQCPNSSDNWTVTSLFASGDDNEELPPALARYCVVSHNTNPDKKPPSSVGDISRDYLAIAGMGAAEDGEIQQSTQEQIQSFPDYSDIPDRPTWLAVIDTSPNGTPADEMSGLDTHGLKVSSVARLAICDEDGDCAARLTSRLAMGYSLEPGAPLTRDAGGGTMGSLSDLSLAIMNQVRFWENDSTAPMVLNLSLAWNPMYGGEAGDINPPVAAVYDALRYASCQGVLVVAATGNRDTAGGESGPAFPAAWESRTAPDADTCEKLFGDWWLEEDHTAGEDYTPLVYGVGGVDIRGETLANQRTNSQPRLNAAGSHLMGNNATSGEGLQPITGTSAATVVVASAAAVVWSHAPDESPHTIMRLLHESAIETVLETADYCFDDGLGGTCGPSNIIRVCEALAYACDGNGATCPAAYAEVECGEITGPLVPGELSTSNMVDFENATTAECVDGSTIFYVDENESSNCPSVEMDGAISHPYTLPTPHDPQCPWCVAYLGNEAVGEGARIELMMMSMDLSELINPTIVVVRRDQFTHYPLGRNLSGPNAVIILPESLDESVIAVVLEYTRPGVPVFLSEPLHLTW